ncbi:hypothetical protein DPMN_167585 [Dreissena polymorpha]|uniref:Uncharacterized protein n=1 Tax=Dreissena polymorpha TaxID=45954 RepID=A0A9D4F4S9_DREPO|nr:hypothetical protein DPMN_167585 [Dreissena polymorpha]
MFMYEKSLKISLVLWAHVHSSKLRCSSAVDTVDCPLQFIQDDFFLLRMAGLDNDPQLGCYPGCH